MNAANLVKDLLQGKSAPPKSLPDFKGTPPSFKTACQQAATQNEWQSGWPSLLGRTSEEKQDATISGIELNGLNFVDNPKRLNPVNKLHVICRVNPHRPGSEAQTSRLSVELKAGEYTPALAAQFETLMEHLRNYGWLDT